MGIIVYNMFKGYGWDFRNGFKIIRDHVFGYNKRFQNLTGYKIKGKLHKPFSSSFSLFHSSHVSSKPIF